MVVLLCSSQLFRMGLCFIFLFKVSSTILYTKHEISLQLLYIQYNYNNETVVQTVLLTDD